MYKMEKKTDTVRIPPDRLDEDLAEAAKEIAKEKLEGVINDENKLVILATNIERLGDGKVVLGDGGVYQDVRYGALEFELIENELILGYLCEVLKFGAFVRFGPLDGLLHISQIMNDKVEVDQGNQRLVGKETDDALNIDDEIRARIVTVSVNERNPRESKIGLTMRQEGLGKLEWIEEDEEEEEEE
ncbi:MAG: DNA-directed RNA polymerase [Candidatus Thermoplasmatota archaeon]|nr:DNA-directed RNA polymerase [Candidatus Thermoplasmatota archaeon]